MPIFVFAQPINCSISKRKLNLTIDLNCVKLKYSRGFHFEFIAKKKALDILTESDPTTKDQKFFRINAKGIVINIGMQIPTNFE